ncbi:MAG: hypothetical protein ACJ76W_04070 [Chloroflexota bacterium]
MKTQRMSPRLLPVGLAAFLTFAVVLVGCSSAASTRPSIAIPSVNASAAASIGMQAALTALDQVDAAITANEGGGGLSAENATSLKTASASIRTALQTGDLSAARTAVQEFSTKLDQAAASLNGDAGKKLQDALAALKASVPGG